MFLFLYWLLMRSRWWFGSCCQPPVFQLISPHGCHNVTSIVQNSPLSRGLLVIDFLTSHREVPSATAPSRCQQCARDPSKGMFQNNRSVSKAVQISIRLSISNRRICFLLKENHWHCVSVSNQPHMPFCKNFSLIITVPSFFFPTNLPLLSSKRRTWSYHWPRITGNEQQRLHHGVGSAFKIWKTGITFLPTS